MGVRDHVLLQSPSTDGVEGRRDDSNKSKLDRRAALLSKNNRRKIPNSPNLAAASNRKRLSSSEEETKKRSDRRERARRRSARERSRSTGELQKRRSRSSSSKSERCRHNRKPMKRVHFETDNNDRIITHFAPPSSTRLGMRERNHLWWSPQECELKINRINEIADAYQGKRFYVERFVELFALCAQVDDDDIQIDAKTMADIRKFVQTPARGLEALILSVLQRYRTRHVEVILNAQQELMLSSSSSLSEDTPSGSSSSSSSSSSFNRTNSNMNPALLEERDRTLFELSQRNSRAGRLFAQVLARTDAAAGTSSSSSR